MAANKVVYNGSTLIDLTNDTVTPEKLAQGITAHDKSGNIITGIMSGGGLPSGISALKFGTDTVDAQFTTTRRTVTHGLGVAPDLVIYWHEGNVQQTYSMLMSIRSTQMGYRSSAYNCYNVYHGNSSTNVSVQNTNSTTYGVSNFTATTFQVASTSSSYYWRAGTYNWIAIKF